MTRSKGHLYSSQFGAYRRQRAHLIDASWAGKGTRGIKGILFRHDTRVYSSREGGGRTWASVVLTMSEVVTLSRSRTFSNNQLINKTKVFSGSVNFPTISGWQPNLAKFAIAPAPFTSSWVYSGKAQQAMVAEYVFQGGTLANNQSWTGSSGENYYLDAESQKNFGNSDIVKYGLNTCKDTRMRSGSTLYPVILTYAKDAGDPLLNNRMEFRAVGTTRPRGTALYGVGGAGNAVGWSLPGACNKLHLDPAAMLSVNTGRSFVEREVHAEVRHPAVRRQPRRPYAVDAGSVRRLGHGTDHVDPGRFAGHHRPAAIADGVDYLQHITDREVGEPRALIERRARASVQPVD